MKTFMISFLVTVGIAQKALGDPPDPALHYQEEVFELVEEANILGTADKCGFVSQNFGMTVSIQLVDQAMNDAVKIWPAKLGEISEKAKEAWQNAVVELEAAHANGEGHASYERCQTFQAGGGVQVLTNTFPNAAQ